MERPATPIIVRDGTVVVGEFHEGRMSFGLCSEGVCPELFLDEAEAIRVHEAITRALGWDRED